MWRVTVISENLQGQSFELKQGCNTIGREKTCDIHLDDSSVSGHHCTIDVENGSYTVKDSGSTNGTCINETEIEEQNLHAGDILNVGSVDLKIESGDEQPQESKSPSQQITQQTLETPAGFKARRNRKMAVIILTVLASMAALGSLAYFVVILLS